MRLRDVNTTTRPGSPQDPLSLLLERTKGVSGTTSEEASKIQDAVERWEKLGGTTLSFEELESVGVPRRHHAAIVYYALSRKYPELVPHMTANSIAVGLQQLAGLSAPELRSKVQSFLTTGLGSGGTPPDLAQAKLSSVDLGTTSSPRVRLHFALPPERTEPLERWSPRSLEAGLEIWSSGPIGYEGGRWMVSLKSQRQSWTDERHGDRSMDTLGLGDLEALERLLAGQLPKPDADPLVLMAARENPQVARLNEALSKVRSIIEDKRGALREAFETLLAGRTVGRVDDKQTLGRLALVLAPTHPPRA